MISAFTEIARESIEAEVAFLHFGAVALDAMLLEKGLRGSCHEEGRGEEGEKDTAQGHEDIMRGDWKSVQMRSGF
jgi:hypothetical protein